MENKSGQRTSQTKVIIDTDAGVDDALALFLALSAHKDPNTSFTIVGITTVFGNATVDNVGKNVFKVLDCAGVNDVPVYAGAGTPLVEENLPDKPTHFGKDGFGDIPSHVLSTVFTAREDRQLEKESAVFALIRLAREHKNELTVMAVGPLTNIAIARKVDPEFERNVKELYVMGGNVYGVGNVRPCVEFNFLMDPESAHVVLSATWNKNIVLVPWETCMKVLPPHQWRKEVLGSINTKPIRLMNLIEENAVKNYAKWYGHGKWISADSVCMAALIRPNIVSSISTKFCTVELHGFHTRGQMVVDHPNRTGNSPNVTIIEGIDTPKLEKMFLHYFNRS